MISAICTPTALSCRCTWAVTNSRMRASCRRSGRTTASLFLSSWSRYGGGSCAHRSARTSRGRPNEMTTKKEKEHLFIYSGYFWKAVVQNRLFCVPVNFLTSLKTKVWRENVFNEPLRKAHHVKMLILSRL